LSMEVLTNDELHSKLMSVDRRLKTHDRRLTSDDLLSLRILR